MIGSENSPILCAGVDLGLSGGIVALDNRNQIHAQWTFRKIDEPRRSTVHSVIAEVIETLGPVRLVIEQPPFMQRGGATNANAICGLWREFGQVLASVDMFALEFATVTPVQWQSRFWKREDAKTLGLNSKQMALRAVAQFWPNWSGSTRAGAKPHEGLVDAALLALWGKTQIWGNS